MAIANTLTGLYPIAYRAMQRVSREMVGAIQGVTIDASTAQAALNQTVRASIAPAATLEDFTPAMAIPETGGATISYVDMTLTASKVAPIPISGEEEIGLNTMADEVMEQRIAQGIRAIVNQIETAICSAAYKGASRAVGTAGTTPFASSLEAAALARQVLDANGAPGANDPNYRSLIIDGVAGVKLRQLANLMTVNANGSDQTLRNGMLLPVVGMGIRESAGIVAHTKGTATGFQSNGAYAVGDTTLAVDGSDSGTILAGDVFTFGTAETTTKYIVNSTTASGAAAGNVLIAKPGILAIHADNDEITIGNNYTPNFAFSRNAIALATRAPARPRMGDLAVDSITVTDPVTGLVFTISMYKGYGAARFQVEMVYGVKVIQGEHIAVVMG